MIPNCATDCSAVRLCPQAVRLCPQMLPLPYPGLVQTYPRDSAQWATVHYIMLSYCTILNYALVNVYELCYTILFVLLYMYTYI
jgi:hypothetical protein